MDPTIVASLIGIGGTVAIAISGHVTSVKTNSKTIRAGTANTVAALDAAREQRLWDKRGPIYVQTIAGLRHRQAERQHELNRFRWDNDQLIESGLAEYNAPSWFEAHAQLIAYASPAVQAGYEAASRAHEVVAAIRRTWVDLGEQSKALSPADATDRIELTRIGAEVAATRKTVHPALRNAEAADEALIKLMQCELQAERTQAVVPLPPDPA